MHVVIHANCLVFVNIMALRRYEKIWRKICIPPERTNTVQDVSRVQMEDLAIHNDFRACKFRASGQFLIDDFIELYGIAVGEIQLFSDLKTEDEYGNLDRQFNPLLQRSIGH